MKKFENGILRDTGTFILTFDKTILPAKVIIAWETLQVRQYYDRPMQCKNCFGLGHTKKRCTKTSKCSKCGNENHLANNCDQQPKCINCQQPHIATSRDCYHIQRETSIIKTATDLKISFKEARQQLNDFEKSQKLSFSSTVQQTTTENHKGDTDNKIQKLKESMKQRLQNAQTVSKKDLENLSNKASTSNSKHKPEILKPTSKAPTLKDSKLKPKDDMSCSDDSEDENT
jgi:DNA-binding transcriptional MerR regulator